MFPAAANPAAQAAPMPDPPPVTTAVGWTFRGFRHSAVLDRCHDQLRVLLAQEPRPVVVALRQAPSRQ